MTEAAQLKTVEGKTMNAKEARRFLLSGSAPILRELLREATGMPHDEGDGYYGINKDSRKVVLDAIIPMLQSAGDIQKIEAECAQDVIGLIKEGLITFTEARDLMQMLSTKSDIEDMKTLLDKMEALSGSDQG